MKKRLRIAIVSDAIYPYNKGGKEKRIFELSTRLAKSGHDVHLYCMNWNGLKKQEQGVKIHAISNYFPLYAGKRRSIKEAIFFALSCFKLMKENFDILEADHMPHLVLFPLKIVTLLKRKKLYATWNEVWGRKYWVEYMEFAGNISFLIELLSSRMPDTIIAVSEHTKNKLINDLNVHKKIVVIPNGINVSEIQKVKPAKQKSDVIFAGRLLSHKNVDVLINAIALLNKTYPKIKCFIIGKGPEEKNLKKITKKLHLENNITFFDFLERHEDLYSLMKSSKIFAFPSTREGFGIVALEANACGLPIITTDHKDNAAKELITNGKNGEVITLTDTLFAQTLQKYLQKKDTKTTYLNIAKKYDWDILAKKIEEVYTK